MAEVYLVGVLEGCYKIGRSGDSERRLLSYSPKLPVTLSIHHRISTDDAVWLESLMHAAFAHRRGCGEWFRLTVDDVRLISGLIAIRQGDVLPEWLDTLIRTHHPLGFRPKLSQQTSSEVVAIATTAQVVSIEDDIESRSKANDNGSDKETETNDPNLEPPPHGVANSGYWSRRVRPYREKHTYEVDVDRGDGIKEPVAALRPEDYPRYLLWEIERAVIVEIDGSQFLKRIVWVNGRPALETISGVPEADLIYFDGNGDVRVVAFVKEWLKEWTEDELEEAVATDRERAAKRDLGG